MGLYIITAGTIRQSPNHRTRDKLSYWNIIFTRQYMYNFVWQSMQSKGHISLKKSSSKISMLFRLLISRRDMKYITKVWHTI